MDPDILRAILRSSGKFSKSLKDAKDLDTVIQNVPIIDSTTITTLSRYLTDLLAFKVSPDAHQKYATRIAIIKILREWVRPPMGLTAYPTFCQSAKVSELCTNVANKYLSKGSNWVINDGSSFTDIITLIRSLMDLSSSNPRFINHIKHIINQVIELEIINDSCELVKMILDNENKLKLEISLIEKLYLSQTDKLIEKPLIDCFLENFKNYANLNKENCAEQLENFKANTFSTSSNFEKLLIKISQSAKIFQVMCGVLKALFTYLDYSYLVLNYLEFILNKILNLRSNDKKYLVDLYPVNLQSSIFLLSIEPNHHTRNSKMQLLKRLEEIYTESEDKALILMMHFPKWLDELSLYFSYKMDISV